MLAGRLFQDQAFFRSGREDPPPPSFFQQGQPIGVGSKPKIDSLNPFCPSALPWQPDELQPKRLRIGKMSFSKCKDRGSWDP